MPLHKSIKMQAKDQSHSHHLFLLLTFRNVCFWAATRLQSGQALHIKRLYSVAYLAHLVEMLQLILVTFNSWEQTKWGVIGRLLLSIVTEKVMDLLIVGHILLSEDRLYLVKVPVGDVGHFIDFIGTTTHMSILAIRSTYAETKTIVVALTVTCAHHHHLLHARCLVRPRSTILPRLIGLVWPSLRSRHTVSVLMRLIVVTALVTENITRLLPLTISVGELHATLVKR